MRVEPQWQRRRLESVEPETWLQLAPLDPPAKLGSDDALGGLLTLRHPSDETNGAQR